MYMPQQHVGCSVMVGGILLFSACHVNNTRQKGNNTRLSPQHTPNKVFKPQELGKSEREQVKSLDVVCAQRSQKLHLLEGTRCLFSHT